MRRLQNTSRMEDGVVPREEQKYIVSAMLFFSKVKSDFADLLFGKSNFLSEFHFINPDTSLYLNSALTF